MRILVFSDIHNDWKALERLMDTDADAYFAAGDLVSWARGLEQCGAILARRRPNVYVLPGNHESAVDIAAFCRRFGFHDFHGKAMKAGKWTIGGLGYSNPTPFNTPGEYTESELAEKLAPFAGMQPLIMICHCPPKNTPFDRIREGFHAGSTAVSRFIEQARPAYFFCGHIHEAEGVVGQIGVTTVINSGKRGYLLEVPHEEGA